VNILGANRMKVLLLKRKRDFRAEQSTEYRVSPHFTSNYLSFEDSLEMEMLDPNSGSNES